MEFEHGDAGVIRDVEECEFREVGGMQPVAIEEVCDEHFEEDVMCDDV